MEKKGNFYYKGMWFDTEEEFWKSVQTWNDVHLTEDALQEMFKLICKDIWVNIQMREINITNQEAFRIVSDTFFYSLKEFFKHQKRME